MANVLTPSDRLQYRAFTAVHNIEAKHVVTVADRVEAFVRSILVTSNDAMKHADKDLVDDWMEQYA